MKKRLILGLAALAAVTLTSCQKDQVINQVPQEQAIEFGTYTGRDAQTKATVMDLNGLKGADAGFGVYAYYTGSENYDASTSVLNYMNNTSVKWEDQTDSAEDYWKYTPLKYWPSSNEKITFFAYAPIGNQNITVKPNNDNQYTGDPKLDFTVNENVASQVDLLFAENNNTNKSKPQDGKITFNFKHALSRIGFKATTNISDTSTTVSINSISINGKFYKKGTINLNGGTWDVTDSEKHSKFTVNTGDLVNTSSISSTGVSNLNKDNSTEKGYIMVIPQHFDGTTDDKAFTITVNYTVTTTDANLHGGSSSITHEVTSIQRALLFEQGKAYSFLLNIGLNAVTFDATVEDWITDLNSNNNEYDNISVGI